MLLMLFFIFFVFCFYLCCFLFCFPCHIFFSLTVFFFPFSPLLLISLSLTGLVNYVEAWDRKSSITQQLHTTLHRAVIEAEIRARSRWKRAEIWCNRLKGTFICIVVQAGGWYLLYNLIDREHGKINFIIFVLTTIKYLSLSILH